MKDRSKIEEVNLSEIVLPISLIKKIPPELIKKHQFIPISLKDNILTCAFGELPATKIISDIESATASAYIAYKIKVVLASKSEIQKHLKELFPEPEPQPGPSPKPKPVSRLSKLLQSKPVSRLLKLLQQTRDIGSKNMKLLITAGSGLVIILVVIIGIIMFNGGGDDENKQKEELNNLKNQNQALMSKINELEQEIHLTTADKESSNEFQQELSEGLKALKEEKEELASKIKRVEEEQRKAGIKQAVIAQADKIYQENNKAVVVIFTYDKTGNPLGQGSGFIVRSDGAIVTNFHVVNQAVSIKVKTTKDRYLEVEGVLYCDEANDLVILKVKGHNLPVLKLGDSDKIKPGEKVYVIGSPKGLENTITDGIISGIRQKGIQISAPISSGSSGGPVFNERGEVIGVATSGLKDAQNLNFAMPINLIRTRINNREVLPLEKTLEPNYMDTAEYWFVKGYKLTETGKYKEAIECYKEAIRIKPDYADAHYNLGFAYAKSEDWNKAIESFKKAIRLKPDYAKAHYNLGVVYRKLGDLRKAIESYKKAIRLKPDDVKAHFNLGITCLVIGDRSSALEEYRILKDLDKELANELFYIIDEEKERGKLEKENWENRAKWRRLQKGMTQEQVRAILGEPTRVGVYSLIGTYWHYPGSGDVHFDQRNNRVDSWHEPNW